VQLSAAFQEQAAKLSSHKVLLCQFDVGSEWKRFGPGMWTPYGGCVWYTDFDASYDSLPAELTEDVPTWDIEAVGSVLEDQEHLQKVFAIADMAAQPSWYYDRENRVLYVRLTNFDPPQKHTITVGIPANVRKGGERFDYDGLDFENRLLSVPAIKYEKDDIFSGRLSFDDAEITIDNKDGLYDHMPDFDVFNQQVRLYLGFEELDTLDDFLELGRFYIKDFTIGQGELRIRARDPRAVLQTPVLQHTFTTTDYPNLRDDDSGTYIPVRYGTCRKVEVVCVNRGAYDEDTGQDMVFVLTDMQFGGHSQIAGVDAVYHKEAQLSGSGSVRYTATDLSAGTITIHHDAGAEIDFDSVRVSFRSYEDDSGALIENPIDIIQDMLAYLASKPVDQYNYNLDEITDVKSELWPCFLDITRDDDSVADQIEVLMASTNTFFYVQPDGLYTFRRRDTEQDPVATILQHEILNQDELEAEYNADDVLSSVVVQYAGGLRVSVTDYEQDVFDRFKWRRRETFETNLTSSADALAFGDEIMQFAKDIPPLFAVAMSVQHVDVEINDKVICYIDRYTQSGGSQVTKQWHGPIEADVESWSLNADDFSLELGLRYIRDAAVTRIYTQGWVLNAFVLRQQLIGDTHVRFI
jgi:hypothetical protein